MLTGCNVSRVQVKLTDFEYENTENGFKVSSSNYTDILINQGLSTTGPGGYVEPSEPPLIVSISTLQAEVENNTIWITLK